MTCNPGKAIIISEVADLLGLAFSKASTMENITAAFKTAGIWPFSSQVFSEDKFLPSDVTHVPNINQASTDEESARGCSASTSNEEILNLVMPHHKAIPIVTKRKSRQLKSTTITDPPEKRRFSQAIEEESSSESDEELVLETDDESVDVESSEENNASTYFIWVLLL